MFERLRIKTEICQTLQTDYVALLGQRGTGVNTLIRSLLNEKPLIPDMKFIFVSLPRSLENDNEFKEAVLQQLLAASISVPPEKELANQVRQAVREWDGYSGEFRLQQALNTLGHHTTARYLVIVLNALPKIKTDLLKHLLLMLRDSHAQRNVPGTAGAKLRFLVTGRERLWLLSYKKDGEDSPFNIARRIFLGGLSYEEIRTIDHSNSLETAVKLRDLTGGCPALIQQALNLDTDSDDLSPYFAFLQDHWNALSEPARELLKTLAEQSTQFPHQCLFDHKCPQIPEIDAHWQEAFWNGFLRMRHHELAWRSPIHRAFVREHVQSLEKYSKSSVIKVDLLDRAERLERALQRSQSPDCRDEYLEEALSLAVQSQRASELGPVREASLRVRRSLGDYDVFLCHNSKDKEAVKRIGIKLKERGILPWLDEWDLEPGKVWIDELEIIISQVKSAVVCVGPNQTGPWEKIEIRTLLRKFVEGDLKVIPTILEGTTEEPDWSMFLDDFHRVDFRKQEPNPFEQLVWGVTGQRPSLIT
jgi:hypothetical protein